MNEFSKPYEYFEEKGAGGILLILFFMLISVEPLLGIMAAFVWKDTAQGMDVFVAALIGLSAVYILFSFFAGITLKRLKSYTIPVMKGFLVFRLIFLAATVYASMRVQIGAIPYARDYVEYGEMYGSIVVSFVISSVYVLVFSVGWYLYLLKSKRVRESFSNKSRGAELPG